MRLLYLCPYAALGLGLACADVGGTDATYLHCAGHAGMLRAALYGGISDSAGAVVDEAVAGGVIAARVEGTYQREFCTLTRVDPDWLLTAKHCVWGTAAESVRLTFGPSFRMAGAALSRAPAQRCEGGGAEPSPSALVTSEVLQTVLHEALDLALLRVRIPTGSSLAIARTSPLPGEAVLLVGYGLQETGEGGEQEWLWSSVTRREAGLLRVGDGHGGACVGDSGGPLLRPGADGDFELLGVLSTGSSTCTSFDSYVDLALAADWVAEVVSAHSNGEATNGAR